MKSLYARLLVAFLAVLLLATYAFYRAYTAVTVPPIISLIGSTQAALANEAAIALHQGGSGAVSAYLQRLAAATQRQHHLVDGNGRDVVTGDDRSAMLPPDPGPGRIRLKEDGDRVVFATPAGSAGLLLISIAPVPFQATDFLRYMAVITGVVIALFLLLVATVVHPIRRVAESVQRFGHGDLAARSHVDRRDEIGRLATAFNEMAQRIQTLVTGERRLLQDVSHELNSPLTRLNIGIELLRTASDRQHAADRIQREASRLSGLVAALLEVVRLEGDPESAPLEPVDPLEVLRDSAASCATEANVRGVTLCLATKSDPGELRGNAELLRRAFDNVIGNAARYAPSGSEVTIVCESTAHDYIIDVRDRGPGVLETQLDKLGSAFYRTDASRSSDTGGTGLGLAIARRAIQVHRGSIDFANANPGLQVTVRLPRG